MSKVDYEKWKSASKRLEEETRREDFQGIAILCIGIPLILAWAVYVVLFIF